MFDGPPSWSLNSSETGESKKMPVVRGGGANNVVKRQRTSLCLILMASVAPATATPDWSKRQ